MSKKNGANSKIISNLSAANKILYNQAKKRCDDLTKNPTVVLNMTQLDHHAVYNGNGVTSAD